eukprot:TCALIF_09170-PA protein Name:"Protein of unknown function" AED:0.06 eAED:0.06 QI:0/0.66/0.5/0.75/1/1/4/36/358
MGANDVLLVTQQTGSLLSSPMSLFVSKYANSNITTGRVVSIEINDKKIGLKMTLNSRGLTVFAREEDKYRFKSREWASFGLTPGSNPGLYRVPSSDFHVHFTIFNIHYTKPLILVDLDAHKPENWERDYVPPFYGLENDLDHIIKLCHKLVENEDKQIVYLTDQVIVWDNSVRDHLFEKYQNKNGYSMPLGPVILRQEGAPKKFERKPRVPNMYKKKFLKDLLELNVTIEGVYGTNPENKAVYSKVDIADETLFFGPSVFREKCIELFDEDDLLQAPIEKDLMIEEADELKRIDPEGEENPPEVDEDQNLDQIQDQTEEEQEDQEEQEASKDDEGIADEEKPEESDLQGEVDIDEDKE